VIAKEKYQQVMIRIEGIADPERPLRFEAFRQARNHQLTGYIKSLDLESLLIGIEGGSEDVDHFIGWCRNFFDREEIYLSETALPQIPKYSDFLIMD
jgi:acylphosphatase